MPLQLRHIFGHKLTALLMVTLLGLFTHIAVDASMASNDPTLDIGPPKFTLTDRFGVNILGSTMNLSLNDVAIGGDMGLSHTVGTYTNNFVNHGSFSTGQGAVKGFADKFRGEIRLVEYSHDDINNFNTDGAVFVQRVSYLGKSVDFRIMPGSGELEPLVNTTPEGGVATNYDDVVIDYNYKLEEVTESGQIYYIFTDKDGTEAKFKRTFMENPATFQRPFVFEQDFYRAVLKQVKYPNGFTITIEQRSDDYTSPIYSVKTNTGWQLKYSYKTTSSSDPIVDQWDGLLPQKITGINRAVEYCPAQKGECSLEQEWPEAQHWWDYRLKNYNVSNWGEGANFEVTDMRGGVTKYHHIAFDVLQGLYAIRLSGITPVGATEPTTTFQYRNRTKASSGVGSGFIVTSRGELKSAHIGDHSSAYGYEGTFGSNANGSDLYNDWLSTTGYVTMHRELSVPVRVKAPDGKTLGLYDETYENSLISTFSNGVQLGFYYDSRGNVIKTLNLQNGDVEAKYPASCTSSNWKYCNKPEWVRKRDVNNGNASAYPNIVGNNHDANNRTDYSYWPATGQVKRVKKPANPEGVRPTTYYNYQNFYARWREGSSKVTSTSPVSLLSQQKSCVNSHFNDASGSCSGGDLITITYEYNHDNLLMTGMTTYSQKDGKTLRTCYSYDIYGNRTSETPPNANLTSCPAGRY